jgi:hypothetical protein
VPDSVDDTARPEIKALEHLTERRRSPKDAGDSSSFLSKNSQEPYAVARTSAPDDQDDVAGFLSARNLSEMELRRTSRFQDCDYDVSKIV